MSLMDKCFDNVLAVPLAPAAAVIDSVVCATDLRSEDERESKR